MATDQEQISVLLQKLESLLKKQQDFNIEVNEIRRDIQILRNTQALKFNQDSKEQPNTPKEAIFEKESITITEPVVIETTNQTQVEPVEIKEEPIPTLEKKQIFPKRKSNLEKFIGENLINKIGILITVIGVVIGAKYSIENNLISPLTRIILGYLVGLGLIGFGFKLKAKYENYSAVLVSGALAILYFITFAAYDLYGLFPQLMAFGIMLLCTVFGVVSALSYNKQVIAHIGLVGAYAVPFLLSNDSGNFTGLFSYIALINIGLLVISFKKYWKALYYVSFTFTWLIYGTWYSFSSYDEDFAMGFLFLSIFFFLFYATFLAFKLIKSEQFKVGDIILILLNSFLFYGFGIAWQYDYEGGELYLGLFTLLNALIHFGITVLIFKRKLADRKLFFLTAGFVLTFITIAVPVQLDGNWVTLIWALEAALLFWIGRTKKVVFYEYLSYIMAALAFLSLTMDWAQSYSYLNTTEEWSLLLNTTFLTSILCAAVFGFINWIQIKFVSEKQSVVQKIMGIGVPLLFVSTLYFAFYLEIEQYWNNAFEASKIEISGESGYYPEYNFNLKDLESIWKILYTMFFVSIVSLVNTYKIKDKVLGIVSIVAALLTTLAFLTIGLYILSELRENFIFQELTEFYIIGTFNIYLRYISFAFFAFLLFTIYKSAQQDYLKINYKISFEILLHVSIIWITSSELLNWMDLSGSDQSYKLGLSILWGLYALLLIAIGIWKKKKHLRIGAIFLFSLTLIKLFFYDISSLNTISKTIVFVSLGILLLIISFLYNKYNTLFLMKPKINLLVILTLLAISFCNAQMNSYSKKINLIGVDSLWHNIEVPNEVFGDLNTNMADIRIYGVTATDTVEAPYLHRVSKAEHANSEISFNLLNTVNNSKGFFYTYEVPQKELINEIKLNIQDINFNWLITLEGSQNQNEWFNLLEDYRILSINNDQTDYSFTTLKFPDANFKFYRLLIKSPEKPNLTSVQILKKAKKIAAYRDYKVRSFEVSKEDKKTIIDVDLNNRVPLNLLELTVDDKIDYYRSISIQYLADSVKTEKGYHYNFRPMATKTLSSIEDNSFQLPGTLAQKIRIIILNNDNQPLKISDVRLKGYIHTLTTRFTQPADYFLVYGKKNARRPNYDITKTRVSLPESISNLSFGKVTELPKEEIQTTAPLFENKWWLWAIIAIVIGLLGYFTISMMKKEL